MNDRHHILVMCLDPGVRWHSPKGAAVHLRAMAGGFRKLGFPVSVLTRDGVCSLPTTDTSDEAVFRPIRSVDALGDHMRHLGVGRVSAELGALSANPHALDAARELHGAHPISAIYERYSLWSDVGARAATELGVPFVVEVNAPLIREQSRYRELVLTTVAEKIEQRILASASRVVAVSEVLARELVRKGASVDRVMALPNIAEAGDYDDAEFRAPEPGAPFEIGFSGTFRPWHGLSQFLEVFRLVHRERPLCRLEVLGDGKNRAELESWVRAAGLDDAVRFLGHRAHEDVPAVMGRWHLAVAPYPDLDDFYFSPLKIAEALAAGLPVMASRLGGIPDMLDGGRCGILIAAGDWDGWVREIIDLVDNPARLPALSTRARAHTARWSWSSHASRSLEGLLPLEVEGRARAAS